jgi:hypothetical protein
MSPTHPRVFSVPGPLGGVVIAGSHGLTYLNPSTGSDITAGFTSSLITAWCAIDAQGGRFLLGSVAELVFISPLP